MKKILATFILFVSAFGFSLSAQKGSAVIRETFKPVSDSIQAYLSPKAEINGAILVTRVKTKNNHIDLIFNQQLNNYPIREDDVKAIYSIARELMPAKYAQYKNNFGIYCVDIPLEELSSKALSGIPPTDEIKSNRFAPVIDGQLVNNTSKPYSPDKGLIGRHIAVWQSHGFYYEQSLKRWEWQRARIFETVEDLYTQSYVLPFLVPMLENAGATVLLPRERDIQISEIVVDNDAAANSGRYVETNGKYKWGKCDSVGFSNPKSFYEYGENPFRMGTVREVKCVEGKEDASFAKWLPTISQDGEYAVYVSYSSLKNSCSKARYEVHHTGGTTTFEVNQKMGGGTWIYLGTFGFKSGDDSQGVVLSNISTSNKDVITADAVKFGGGMGNIARKPAEFDEEGKPIAIDFPMVAEVSGYPRFTEGSRYWLQWAGMNDTIYSPNKNLNDYNDDYMSRGRWVNAIAGGSNRIPNEPGYKIPVDLSFAFHTDAGTTLTDSIIGTLAIYTKISNDSDIYKYGGKRLIGREYADIVQTQIVEDIQKTFDPEWKRRGLWNSSYSESRSPEVPALLLELLSHQNLADMRYGLDPTFRFTVSRAIYKGMLKFLSYVNDSPYVVQPLPVNTFSSEMDDNNTINLHWKPTEDALEPTATPNGYVVYTRVSDIDDIGKEYSSPEWGLDGFDNGVFVSKASYKAKIEPGKIYSFKVTAVNEGGESFPSEILSMGITENSKAPTVLVVNNFTRVCAPSSFASKDSLYGGLMDYIDAGVPYIRDISYIGPMHEFRRSIPWMDDDAAGFGASYSNYENKAVAGNTFDYPLIHGAAIMKAGYNFVSTSVSAVCSEISDMKKYKYVDIIAGKQARTLIGRDKLSSGLDIYAADLKFNVFPKDLIEKISEFCKKGGSLLISGANIASNSWDRIYDYTLDSATIADVIMPERQFIQDVLKYKWMTNYATISGKVKGVQNPFGFPIATYSFEMKPNNAKYAVESPDALVPAGKESYSIFRYSDNNISAGVAYAGKDYKCVSLGFPIEALSSQDQIDAIMAEMLKFLSSDIKQGSAAGAKVANKKSSDN